MKRFLKCICLVLVMTLVLSVPVHAEQENEAGTYSSAYFSVTSQYLWKISSTQFQVWFEVTAVRGMTQLGTSQIKVQRSTDQSNWVTVKTYTSDDYPQMLCANTGCHADCVTYTYTAGYYYRALVTFYAKNSSGIGKYSAYTATMRL